MTGGGDLNACRPATQNATSMGGQKRRLRARVQAVGAEIEESIRQDGEAQKLQHVAAAQLFTVDSQGGDAPLSKRDKLKLKDPLVKSRKFDGARASRAEAKQVEKARATLASSEQQPKKQQKKMAAAAPWSGDKKVDEDDYVTPALEAQKPAKRRKVVAPPTRHNVAKVQVPAAGQSYHPDFEAHQDAMAAAVAQELERREIREKMAEPISSGMSEETLQYINDKDSVRFGYCHC